MAKFPKPSRRKLPAPPTADQAPANLTASEAASGDGRAARATGCTKQLATRVREELKVYAAKHRMKLVEVLEQGHPRLSG